VVKEVPETMKDPFGWILGFVWMVLVRAKNKLRPQGSSIWMPRWIQPYWMRCMGFEVNEAVLQFYKSKERP
jgi:hypothetical protein